MQGGFKGIDQAVRQITNEAHRVRQRHRAPRAFFVAQIQLTRGGIQGGKQLVRGIGACFDQGVEQGGFACVGVTHQGNGESVAAVALSPLRGTLTFDLFQPIACALDGFANHASVQFDLRFTWATAHADAPALPLQV